MPNNDQWMTIKEAAGYLKVSEPTLYRWMKDGTVSFYKIGDSTRFKRSSLDEAMEKHTGDGEALQKVRRCASCGHFDLVPGIVQSTGHIYFKPDQTKFFVFSQSTVRTKALTCCACGYIHMYADTEHVEKLRPKTKA